MVDRSPLPPIPEPAPSYARLAVAGGATAVAGQVVKLVANVAVLAVVGARLTPDDLGLASIALLSLAGMAAITDVGLRDTVLSSESERQDRGITGLAWVVAGVAAALTAASAPLIALAAGDDRAWLLILAVAPVAALQVVVTAQEGLYRRAMAFGSLTARGTVALLLGTTAAVLAALLGAGPWALLLQPAVEQVVAMAALAAGPVPLVRPSFRRADLRTAWQTGRSLVGTTAILFAYTNLDDLIVARVAGTPALGRYNLAYRITNAPVYLFTHGTSVVLAPILRRLRTGSEGRLGAAYLRQLRILAWTSAIVLGAVAVFGPSAVDRLFGDRWTGIDVTLRILAVYGLVRAVGATTGSVFIATGQHSMIRRMAQWPTLAMLVVIVPCVLAWGTAGAAAAVTVPLLVATAFAMGAAARTVGIAPVHALRAVAGPWAAAGAVTAAAVTVGVVAGGLDAEGFWPALAAYAAAAAAVSIPFLRALLAAVTVRRATVGEPDE